MTGNHCRRHRSRRSVKNLRGPWVTLHRLRPRPAQLATASATISQEDREKTHEMATQTSCQLKPSSLVTVATQILGPTSQDDDLRAQVTALQMQVPDETVSKQTLYSRLCGAREDSEKEEKAIAALRQQVLDPDLQGQVMTGQATFQDTESSIHWQHHRISQLQEELRIHV